MRIEDYGHDIVLLNEEMLLERAKMSGNLIGVIVVGTGIPMVCNEREVIRNYFEKRGFDGFDYAYKYPGMNKVLQAAGRVIRTSEDVGVVALLDDRFLQASYRALFPREWRGYKTVLSDSVNDAISRFWSGFKDNSEAQNEPKS